MLDELAARAGAINPLFWTMAIMAAVSTAFAVLVRGRAALTPGEGVLRSVRVNLSLLVLNNLLAPVIAFGAAFANPLYAETGLPHLTPAFWSLLPAPLVLLAAVAAWDLVNYWNHRILHAPALWSVHAVHHSDPDVNWTTAYRVHVGEIAVMRVSEILVIAALGFPPEIAAISAAIHSTHNYYVHMNLPWSHGPLEGWIASPNWHRWHHADDPAFHDRNFAQLSPVWDRVFGTYTPAPRVCDVALGFDGSPGQDLVANALHPFRRGPVRAWSDRLVRGLKARRPAV